MQPIIADIFGMILQVVPLLCKINQNHMMPLHTIGNRRIVLLDLLAQHLLVERREIAEERQVWNVRDSDAHMRRTRL